MREKSSREETRRRRPRLVLKPAVGTEDPGKILFQAGGTETNTLMLYSGEPPPPTPPTDRPASRVSKEAKTQRRRRGEAVRSRQIGEWKEANSPPSSGSHGAGHLLEPQPLPPARAPQLRPAPPAQSAPLAGTPLPGQLPAGAQKPWLPPISTALGWARDSSPGCWRPARNG